MSNRFFFTLAALIMLAGCDQGKAVMAAQTAALNAQADSLKNGRYQVVNGMPSAARYIMLLDTKTGRSWVVCAAKDGSANWCAMAVDGGTTPRNIP